MKNVIWWGQNWISQPCIIAGWSSYHYTRCEFGRVQIKRIMEHWSIGGKSEFPGADKEWAQQLDVNKHHLTMHMGSDLTRHLARSSPQQKRYLNDQRFDTGRGDAIHQFTASDKVAHHVYNPDYPGSPKREQHCRQWGDANLSPDSKLRREKADM